MRLTGAVPDDAAPNGGGSSTTFPKQNNNQLDQFVKDTEVQLHLPPPSRFRVSSPRSSQLQDSRPELRFIMQRGATYGQSPPLHHPVPQHVSTVPQLRSPPPPPGSAQSQQGAYGGTPYQQQGGTAGNVFGQYGQFMSDPTAQVAAQFGQTALRHGQDYVEQNVGWTDTHTVGVVTNSSTVWSLCQRLCAEALLQRVQFLCPQQAIPGALPLEAQAVVAKAGCWRKWSGGLVSPSTG